MERRCASETLGGVRQCSGAFYQVWSADEPGKVERMLSKRTKLPPHLNHQGDASRCCRLLQSGLFFSFFFTRCLHLKDKIIDLFFNVSSRGNKFSRLSRRGR